MNTSSKGGVPEGSLSREDRFDAAMRALHRDALAHVSPGVRWKLRPVTGAKSSRTDRAGAWRMGAALAGVAAAIFALALGVSLWRPVEDANPAASALAAESADDGATVLEQDPDFYAWLASDDADLLAME
jgi:hypothetical protein